VLALNAASWQAVRITGENERQNCVRRLAEGRDRMDNWIRAIQAAAAPLRGRLPSRSWSGWAPPRGWRIITLSGGPSGP
jgi:hypothetical protein